MVVANIADCSKPCAGDATLTCGAGWRMQVRSLSLVRVKSFCDASLSRCTTPPSRLPPKLRHQGGSPTAPPAVPKTPQAAYLPMPLAPATSSPLRTPRPPAWRTAPTRATLCRVWSMDLSATAETNGRTALLHRIFPPRLATCGAPVHRVQTAVDLGRSRYIWPQTSFRANSELRRSFNKHST